jgi:peptidoglycan-associated lipoprotein
MTTRDSLVTVVIVLAIALAGCGQKTTKTAETPPPTASAIPAEPPPPAQEPRPPAEPPGAAPRAVTAGPSSPQPAPAAPGLPQSIEEFAEESALQDVFFAVGRVDIGPSAVRFMRENARWINENRGYLVLIEGHSDNRGTPENNFAMGDRRAKAAATFFLKEGVADTRLFTVSHGSDRPVCDEKTDACAARNRRVHFRVKKQ